MTIVIETCSIERQKNIGNDARALRKTIASVAIEREGLPVERDVVRFYPRSLSYSVDTWRGHGTFVDMYGTTPTGETVAARVTGFSPYAFVRVRDASDEDIERFVEQLNDALVVATLQANNGSLRSSMRRFLRASASCPRLTWHKIINGLALKSSEEDRGFSNSTTERFVQIFFYAPAYVRVTRDLLERVWDARDYDYSRHIVELLQVPPRSTADEAAEEPPTKRLKPTEQRAVDAARNTTSLTSLMSRLDDDDNEAGPWNDAAVDVGGEDDDAVVFDVDDSSSEGAHRYEIAAFAEMRCRLRPGESIQRSLRLSDDRAVEVFEADIDFVLRYAIDAGFKPEEAIELVPDAHVEDIFYGEGTNDIEFTAPYTSLRRVADERFQNTVAPQVCLSLDCEMELGENFAFPKPQSERVLQICMTLFDPVADPDAKHAVHRAFVLDSIALPSEEEQRKKQSIIFDESMVYAFDCEEQMLLSFSEFVRALQPDMITGYNIEGFDLTYLLERAEVLGIADQMSSITRSSTGTMRSSDRSFSSSAHGTHLYKEVSGDGLFIFDVYQALKRSTAIKLRSYSLEYVSTTFLGDRKDDVSYSKINEMQTTPEGRYALMHYCQKDALLPTRLIGKLALHLNNIVMARLTGVSVDMVVRRGLQVRLKSYLYRIASTQPVRHLFFTRTAADRRASEGSSYEGAHVEKPVTGLHDEPVVTLDFNSLYPSIIRTLNMCYKTLVPGRQRAARGAHYSLDPEADVWTCVREAVDGEQADQPTFVHSTHTPGLIPQVIAELLAERKAVRARIPGEPDPFKRSLLKMQQLTIKLLANSLYGFLGAPSSNGYCPEIAAAVTAIGRMVIRESKTIVEAAYRRGARVNDVVVPYDAQVIYGDTDSIFVRLHVPKGAERIAVDDGTHENDSVFWGKHMAKFVTEHFADVFGRRPDNIMRIVFEKTFYPWLSYGKKRYVGWKYELDTDASTGVEFFKRGREPDFSGMETERRDSCIFIANAVRHVVRLLLEPESSRVETLERVRAYIANDVIGTLDAGLVPWNELIQSKQFRKRITEYTAKGQTAPIHILLVDKLERRRAATGQGTTYNPGDRVQFVVVEADAPGRRTGQCGEDPDYAWTHGMRLSREHYVLNGVHKIMARTLAPVLGQRTTTTRTLGSLLGLASSSVDDDVDTDARKDEKRFAEFMSGVVAKAQSTSHVQARTGLAALARASTARCRLCGALGSRLCSSHGVDEREALERSEAARRASLDEARLTLARECQACKQGWRVRDDEARAERLERIGEAADIEEALPCDTNTCDIYWRRRMNDRRRH